MLKPLAAGGEPLYKLLQRKVFYIRNFMPPSAREKYTQALADFPDPQSCVSLWLFWRPQLEQIVDLGARRREYQERREAAGVLACAFRRAYAARVKKAYADKQRSVQIKRVCQLRHNEIRRKLQPAVLVDSIENDWHFARQRKELADYADTVDDRSASFPVRYVAA